MILAREQQVLAQLPDSEVPANFLPTAEALVLDYVVERKEVNDLAQSLSSKRYDSQKARLLQTGPSARALCAHTRHAHAHAHAHADAHAHVRHAPRHPNAHVFDRGARFHRPSTAPSCRQPRVWAGFNRSTVSTVSTVVPSQRNPAPPARDVARPDPLRVG